MRTDKQRHPWPWWRRLWREVVWAFDLDDGSGDGSPSLTKWLALVFGALVVVSVVFEKPVTGNQVWLALAAAAIAFGRSTFRAFLTRGSWSGTSMDTNTRTETITRQEIVTRREQGAEDGTEPTD